MIELRHLRYFLAVAEQGHITRAAARLGIQQPPLSQQIRALEAEVGVPLLTRHPRGVDLTEAGKAFLAEARAALEQVERAVEAARRSARGEQGRLAIGYTSSTAFHPLIPAVVRAFRQAAPAVALELEESSTGELIEALRRERLDAAFVRTPVGDTAGLVIAPLLRERMLVVLPAQHPLAQRPATALALAELAEETFILYRRPTGPGLYDAIIAACHAAGFAPHIGQEAPRLLSTLSLVSAGLGVSIIPQSISRLDTEGLAYRALADAPQLLAPLHLAYRAAAVSGPVARLLEQVRQMVREGTL
ncbi:LysR family transcriptional regulator [Bradyrhizobium sp. WD16]|uniref:LysR family transcriptional regulator n=1 Tax=Bradyrhizobium sp. WD16 TaxID=1521768 RepID=UPI0020A5816D|nr:LysR family transcriptional regulator [Bradyrhizobium sp. WD16]UTD26561.1 LysR family transcriptional regulator [Bradyrhizobium sp. WD16]